MEVKDLQVFPDTKKDKIDVFKFEGKRVPIDKVEIIDALSSYNEKGDFVEGLKRPVKKLKISTSVLETVMKADGTPIEIRATAFFNLKCKLALDGKEIWGISQHPKSKLFQFMKKQKISGVDNLKGTLVTITAKPSTVPGDEREFLTIAI